MWIDKTFSFRSVCLINLRCGDLRLQMRRWLFLVVRPRLSRPNHPTSLNLEVELEQHIWFFGITKSTITNVSMLELVHQAQTISAIACKIEIHNAQFADLFTRKANSEKFWLGIDNPCLRFFFWVRKQTSAFWGLIAGIFGVCNHQLRGYIPRCRSNSAIFFSPCRIYSLWWWLGAIFVRYSIRVFKFCK